MPAKSKSAPKSRKADGTEKKRWSSAERKDRGHDPRRRGGQSNPSPRREDTIGYEIVTRVGERVPRRYRGGNGTA